MLLVFFLMMDLLVVRVGGRSFLKRDMEVKSSESGRSFQKRDSELKSSVSGRSFQIKDMEVKSSVAGPGTDTEGLLNFLEDWGDGDFRDSDRKSPVKGGGVRQNLINRGVLVPSENRDSLEEIYVREHLPKVVEILKEGSRSEVQEVIEQGRKDPFSLQSKDLKFSELLAADAYFSFLTRTVIYFVTISLILPAIIPLFSLLVLPLQFILQ